MAATDYASLQASVANYLHRTDLTAVIPDFIYYAETKIINNIKARKQEVTITGTLTLDANGVYYIPLPADYGSVKTIQILAGSNYVLKFASDEIFLRLNQDNATGTPEFFSLNNVTGLPDGAIYFAPLADSAYSYSLTYYQDLPHLSNTITTNWLLTQFPRVYLYGTIIEACINIQDFEMLGQYQAIFTDEIEDVWQNATMESFGGTPIQSWSDYIM